MLVCPAQLSRESAWTDPTDAPEYTQSWFVVFHALKWLDFYLLGTKEGCKLPSIEEVGFLT